jgi:hypothetical protein
MVLAQNALCIFFKEKSDFLVFGPFLGPSPQVNHSCSMGTLSLFRRDKNKQNHMKNQRFSWGMQKVTTPTWWCVKRFFGFWTGVHKLSALAWWGPYGFLEEIKANRITWKTSVFHGVCKKLQAQLDGVRTIFWFLDRFWFGAHKSSALAWWRPYGFLKEIKTNRITRKTSVFHGLQKVTA